MRAVEIESFGESGAVQLIDRRSPEPGPSQVQIDVEAIGVNFSDVMQRQGNYYGGPDPPYTPGTEVSGTIGSVGENVDLDVGERVAALVSMQTGAYAESVIAEAGVVFPIPDSLSFKQAAGFPVQFSTAHCALHEWGGIEDGDSVLIHAAAGGVGTAAVQLASLAGGEVFATASTEEKLSLASDLGADHLINYTEKDFQNVICDEMGRHGVDLVLDGVGGTVLEKSLNTLVPFGRVITYGQASGNISEIDNRDVFFENRSILGFHLGNALMHNPKDVFSAIQRLTELLSDASIEIIIDREFPLEQAEDALDYVKDRSTHGKVVLTTN